MAVSKKQVMAELDRDELDYPAVAKKLGKGALPHLLAIVKEADPMRSSKATYLASLLGEDASADVVAEAAKNDDPVVRVAAAGAALNLPEAPEPLLDALLADQDPGVRKVALRTVADGNVVGLKDRVEELAEHDSQEHLRGMAATTRRGLRG